MQPMETYIQMTEVRGQKAEGGRRKKQKVRS